MRAWWSGSVLLVLRFFRAGGLAGSSVHGPSCMMDGLPFPFRGILLQPMIEPHCSSVSMPSEPPGVGWSGSVSVSLCFRAVSRWFSNGDSHTILGSL